MSSSHHHADHDSDEERQRVAALWTPSAAQSGSLKPHRHIHIDWPNASIKKQLAIGASAPDASPPIYDRPREQDERDNAASCVLVTKSSPISATVHIIREASSAAVTTDKPILISAKTSSVGSISLTIPSYTGARPLNIRAKSYNGNITLHLPHSFSGLLNWSSETGTLKLSRQIQQRLKHRDNHKHRGSAIISPSIASGLRADVCTLTNHHGSITIKEVDEDSSTAADKSCAIQ